jgi:cell wall-associated NlpC family hydrolase
MQRKRPVGVPLVVTFFLLLSLFAAALLPSGATASPISDKKAKANEIQRQLQTLNGKMELAVEAYDQADAKLAQVRQQITRNTRELELARYKLAAARRQLSDRVVELYKQRPTDLMDVLLGTRSFTDLVTQLGYMNLIGQHDAQLVSQVEAYKHEVAARRTKLLAQRKQASELVAQRAAQKQSIAGDLAQRKQMLAGVEKEIKALEAAAARAAAARAAAAQAAAQRAAARAAQAAAQTAGSAADTSSGSGQSGGITTTGGGHAGAVDIARRYLGVPYVWGGASPRGFDCSGLVMYVYAQLGISLPHSAAMQYGYGVKVARSALQPGDLVFFGSSAASIHHVGIYAGGGTMIDAPYTGAVVRYDSLSSDCYGAVRL